MTSETKANVIMCNEVVMHVFIGSKNNAEIKLNSLLAEHKKAWCELYAPSSEYGGRHHWHIRTGGFTIDE